MANGQDNTKEPSSSSAAPPPPMDPFARYQTPYPRSSSNDEENPFIQFRRFADESISSLFNSVPQMLGFTSADSFHKEIEDVMRRRNEMEEGWKKQLEQEMEEMKQRFERERDTIRKQLDGQQKPAEDSLLPWWQKGKAKDCPALNGQLQPEGKKEKCPALFDHAAAPRTELDAYEVLQKAQIEPAETAQKEQRSGWLSSLGYDGKQKQDNHDSSRQGLDSAGPLPARYTVFRTRRMDPVENTDHTIPWLMLNPYSPVYLCNPEQPRLCKVNIQDNQNIPFQISNPRFAKFWMSSEVDDKMAKQLPWADAFEDLVSLQQTGKMPERTDSTWRTPSTWIHDMVSRGSLGPQWGFNEQGQLVNKYPSGSAKSQGLSHELMRQAYRERTKRLAGTEEAWPAPDDVLKAMGQRETAGDDSTPVPTNGVQHDASLESQPKVESSPSSAWTWFTASSSSWNSNSEADSVMVVSSSTTTERRTHPDGSIETKRLIKKKFADGREESNETVEMQNGPRPRKELPSDSGHDKYTQTPVQDELKKQQGRKSGWFWN